MEDRHAANLRCLPSLQQQGIDDLHLRGLRSLVCCRGALVGSWCQTAPGSPTSHCPRRAPRCLLARSGALSWPHGSCAVEQRLAAAC